MTFVLFAAASVRSSRIGRYDHDGGKHVATHQLGVFGGGFNAAARFDSGSTNPIDVMIGTGGDWYCDICNPFQYATSIMGNPAQRQEHIKDVIDFFDELDHGRLRAVS